MEFGLPVAISVQVPGGRTIADITAFADAVARDGIPLARTLHVWSTFLHPLGLFIGRLVLAGADYLDHVILESQGGNNPPTWQ